MNDWENVWKRKGLLTIIVDSGRGFYNKFFFRFLKKYVNKNTKLLEVGCGTSSLSLQLCSYIKKFTGLDISEEALRISKRNADYLKVKNANFVKGSCFKTPFKDNSYDIVWSQGLIEHFDDPLSIVKEHVRVCKKNGYTLVSVPYDKSYMKLWHIMTRPKIFQRFWPWTDCDFYSKEMLKSIAEKIGKPYRVFVLSYILGVVILEIKK